MPEFDRTSVQRARRVPFTNASRPSAAPAAREQREIADRYQVRGLLGRGGMGAVYRVHDTRTQRELALKQLEIPEGTRSRALIESLFEAEFRTLTQLTHPRVVEVYDYGLDESGPYYTMEILSGSSLAECAPLPWREACALMYDVCSCLAVLHSRRLLHRDVTPQNVRRTADGRAKLIDFGAMVTMGHNSQVVGTASFMAPEVAHQLTLDARTDLFAAGGTLYFALTGSVAYRARSLDDLALAWRSRPAPPSAFDPAVPPRLDALVLDLLSLEPALRPSTAAEVMQRLKAAAGLEHSETFDASSVYLGTPTLTGRDSLVEPLRAQARRAKRRRGGAWLFEGGPGSGRTRMLDAAAWQAQVEGLHVLRAAARTAGRAPFSLVRTLTEQLVDKLPALCHEKLQPSPSCAALLSPDPARAGELQLSQLATHKPEQRAQLQDALTQLWLDVADDAPLALLVDDVDQVDDASAGFLVTLADRALRHGLLLSCSASDAPGDPALNALRQRCERATLSPLTAADTEQLLRSVFGDAGDVPLLADRVFRVAHGNPAAIMALLRHLLEQKQIAYEGGQWLLPSRLEAAELPATLDAALLARIERLSKPARRLAEWHALSTYSVLCLSDQAWLCEWAGDGSASTARAELLQHGILVHDGEIFSLVSEAWASALRHAVPKELLCERQQALAELGLATEKSRLRSAYHLFEAGLPDRALDVLGAVIAISNERGEVMKQDLSLSELGRLFMRALTAADALGRSPRLRAELRRCVTGLASVCEDVPFDSVAPEYLAILRRDSGLDDWEALADVTDPALRLTQALQRAAQRYAAVPEEQRTYRVDEAIKHLIGYTVTCIGISTSRYDAQLCRSLPGLIAPFARLSPLIECMLNNCLAAREISVDGRYVQGRERWNNVLTRLGDVSGDAMRYVDVIRYSIAFALGCLDAAGGLESAEHWARHMESLPLPLIDAYYLRRVVRLQQGDFEGAEHYRRQAELLAVKTGARPLYASVHALEFTVYTQARDFAGLTQVVERIKALADRHPGWLPYYRCARGCQELLRGDLREAKRAFEAALALCTPDASEASRPIGSFVLTASFYVETLLELGEFAQARAFAERSLAQCAAHEILTTDALERGLAVAESRLGEHASAAARLDRLLARQRRVGVTGLILGASYEARARVAIAAQDKATFEEYAQLTASAYRYAQGFRVGTRYLRLMREAQRAGVQPAVQATEYESDVLSGVTLAASVVERYVASALQDATTTEQRAQRALGLISETAGARSGQFYVVDHAGSLRWVAAHLTEPANEVELQHARACLARAQSDAAQTTLLLTADHSAGPSVGSWTGAGGVVQQAFLVTAIQRQSARHMAVVLLEAPATHAGQKLHDTLRAVAHCMLQADAELGVTAVD